MLYVRAIVAPVESSTPSSPDINVKVRAEHDPRSSFLTIRDYKYDEIPSGDHGSVIATGMPAIFAFFKAHAKH